MQRHTPVLRDEVHNLLSGGRVHSLMIDATVGDGGHAECFLSRDADLSVIGVDADPEMIERASARLQLYGERLQLVNSRYSAFFDSYQSASEEAKDRPPADLILFDLGVSMYHFLASGRGFSFSRDEPLDMRIDKGRGQSAAELINRSDFRELERILVEYGQEPRARRIARAIVESRSRHTIARSRELAEIVAAAVPASRRGRIHPATLTFQALRIAVNGELEEISEGLRGALRIMRVGGRMGVISFHSLEDRLVKRFFRDRSGVCTCPPEAPLCTCGRRAEVVILTRRPVTPGPAELEANPSSRSAKLRVAEKVEERQCA